VGGVLLVRRRRAPPSNVRSLRDRNGGASPLRPCTAELCSPLADASHSENISCKIHGSGYPGFAKLATGRVRPTADFRGAHCLPAVCGRSCVAFNRDTVLNAYGALKSRRPLGRNGFTNYLNSAPAREWSHRDVSEIDGLSREAEISGSE